MSLLDAITAERAKYGERLSPPEAIALLKAVVAGSAEYGLLAKSAGNQWDGYALDIIAHRGGDQHYDVFIDGPDASQNYHGTAQPAWQPKGPYDPARFVPIPGTSVPDPGTPPAPPADDGHAAMVEQIGALTELANEFLAEADRLNAAIAASNTRLDDIERRLAELVKPRTYSFTGSTGRQWGHSHPVSFTVEI